VTRFEMWMTVDGDHFFTSAIGEPGDGTEGMSRDEGDLINAETPGPD
jgi:hypothetical protein